MTKRPGKHREGPRLIGYARVSTAEQSLDMQVQALIKANVHPDDIFQEQVSGIATRRTQLELAIQASLSGDTLVVWKLDRVGRSLLDLLEKLDRIEKRGIGFRSLTEGIDTKTPGGRLIMHVMGALAQFERDLVVERTKAGMRAYVERGGRPGPGSKITPEELPKAEAMIRAGAPVKAVADHYGCAPNTVYNRIGRRRIQLLQLEQ